MRCYFNYILKLLGAIYTAGGDQDAYYFRILLNESYCGGLLTKRQLNILEKLSGNVKTI